MIFHYPSRQTLITVIILACLILNASCETRQTPDQEQVSKTYISTSTLTPTPDHTPEPSSTTTAAIPSVTTSSTLTRAAVIDQKDDSPINQKTTEAESHPSATVEPRIPNTPTPFVGTPLARENTPIPQSGTPITFANASEVVELSRLGKGTVNNLAYTPNGDILAVATSLGIYFYDQQQTLVNFLETDQPVQTIAFSPAGDVLASGSILGRLQFWKWKENILLNTLEAETKLPMYHLAFSPDGNTIAFALTEGLYWDGKLIVLNAADGSQVFGTDLKSRNSFQYTPDSQSIYIIVNGSVYKYSLSDGKELAQWDLQDLGKWEVLNNFAITSDEKTMVVSSNEKVYFWNLTDSAPYQSFEIPDDIYTAHWAYKADTCFFYVDGGGDRYYEYAISPDNQTLVVEAGNGSIQIRRIRDGALIAATPEKNKFGQTQIYVSGFTLNPNRPEIAIQYSTGPIEILNTSNMNIQNTITGTTEGYYALAFSPVSPEGRSYLAAGSSDQITRIWNLSEGQRAADIDSQALSISYSIYGKYLAWGSNDWTFNLLNLQTGQQLGPISAHQDWVSGVAFTPDQKTLITGSNDCTVKIWDIGESIEHRKTLGGKKESQMGPVKDIVISSDGDWLIISTHFIGYLYNLRSGQIYTLKDLLFGIAISPDSRFFVSASGSGLSITNIETLEVVHRWSSLEGTHAAYSPDGSLIAISTYEGIIALVDAQTGHVLRTLQGHRGAINDIEFSKDGLYLATSANDGTIRLWGIP